MLISVPLALPCGLDQLQYGWTPICLDSRAFRICFLSYSRSLGSLSFPGNINAGKTVWHRFKDSEARVRPKPNCRSGHAVRVSGTVLAVQPCSPLDHCSMAPSFLFFLANPHSLMRNPVVVHYSIPSRAFQWGTLPGLTCIYTFTSFFCHWNLTLLFVWEPSWWSQRPGDLFLGKHSGMHWFLYLFSN